MNCLEFRRSIMVEPATQTVEVLQHAAGCKTCESFLYEQQAVEEDLRKAVMTPVPE